MVADIAHTLKVELCGPTQSLRFLDQKIEVAPIRVHDMEKLVLMLCQNPAFQFSAHQEVHCIGLGQATVAQDIPRSLPAGLFVWRACEFPSIRAKAPEVEPDWSDFTTNVFVLPAIGIVSTPSYQYLFTCEGAQIQDVLNTDCIEEIDAGTTSSMTLAQQPEFSPTRVQWQNAIERVTGEMDDHYTKVVFARKATYEAPASASSVLTHLMSKQARYSGVMRTQKDMFAFASPERLFKREKRELYTEAVAGTRKLGDSQSEQQQLRETLLNSAKDLREHEIVSEYISAQLASLTQEVEIHGPEILKSSSVQHLYTRIRATLSESVSDRDITNALHPTPAVLGTPRSVALKSIEALELWQRGLYAGAIGVHVGCTAEYCVAIRSVLLQNDHLHVFTGAGIVAESKADLEWDEIQQKLASVVGT